MTKKTVWKCDRCGDETLPADMEDVWQPYQLSADEGHICPDCYPAVFEGFQKLMNGDSQSDSFDADGGDDA